MPEKPPKIKSFEVTEGDKKQTVIIPDFGDKQETEYLIQAETEKTKEQLKKKPDKPKMTDSQREQVAGALKELTEFKRRKREGTGNKRYF